MNKILLHILVTSSLMFVHCATPNTNSTSAEQPATKQPLSYLALGDSYTIGESVAAHERFPVQLAKLLTKKGSPTTCSKIIAQTGWRTDNLLQAMKTQLHEKEQYDLVSVLIGVNNQFQKKSIEVYEKDLRTIFDQAISLCKKGKKGVFAISIPDYGATPFGASRAKEIGSSIDQWNAVFERVTKEYGLAWYDITPISREGATDNTLVAVDGLHPSGKMYGAWTRVILERLEF